MTHWLTDWRSWLGDWFRMDLIVGCPCNENSSSFFTLSFLFRSSYTLLLPQSFYSIHLLNSSFVFVLLRDVKNKDSYSLTNLFSFLKDFFSFLFVDIQTLSQLNEKANLSRIMYVEVITNLPAATCLLNLIKIDNDYNYPILTTLLLC